MIGPTAINILLTLWLLIKNGFGIEIGLWIAKSCKEINSYFCIAMTFYDKVSWIKRISWLRCCQYRVCHYDLGEPAIINAKSARLFYFTEKQES